MTDTRTIFERLRPLTADELQELIAYGRRLARNSRQRYEARRKKGMTERLRTEIQADRDDAVDAREPWIS